MPASNNARDVLPSPLPFWPGLLVGAIFSVSLAFLARQNRLPAEIAPYFSGSVFWIHGVTIFYLVTVIRNYVRLKRQHAELPTEFGPDDRIPAWFERSVKKATDALHNAKLHNLQDLHNSIDQKESELRATFQLRYGWLHLLPLGMVVAAFAISIAAVTNETMWADFGQVFLPLVVATIEAVICVIVMTFLTNRTNSFLASWNSAARIRVKWSEESELVRYNSTGEVRTFDSTPQKLQEEPVRPVTDDGILGEPSFPPVRPMPSPSGSSRQPASPSPETLKRDTVAPAPQQQVSDPGVSSQSAEDENPYDI